MGAAAAWAIPAAISLIGGLYSANRSNKAAQSQKDLTKKQEALFNETKPSAQEFLGQSKQALGPTLGYYSSVLSNPREATAPEQNRISSLYRGQATNARNQMPRGGYGPSAAENIRSQERGAQQNAIMSARPMAAQNLGSLGLGLAGLGYQGYGLGAGILGNVFNQGLEARQQQYNQGAGIGNGLFNAYQGYLLSRATQQPGTSPSGTGAGGGGNGFNFASAYQTPREFDHNPPPSGWSGFAGSNLYGTPNSGPSGNP